MSTLVGIMKAKTGKLQGIVRGGDVEGDGCFPKIPVNNYCFIEFRIRFMTLIFV